MKLNKKKGKARFAHSPHLNPHHHIRQRGRTLLQRRWFYAGSLHFQRLFCRHVAAGAFVGVLVAVSLVTVTVTTVSEARSLGVLKRRTTERINNRGRIGNWTPESLLHFLPPRPTTVPPPHPATSTLHPHASREAHWNNKTPMNITKWWNKTGETLVIKLRLQWK